MHRQFDNRPSGFKELLAWAKTHSGKEGMLFCLEHTGIYALPLCWFFTQEKLSYSQQSALQGKKSMGIQRGNSHKTDAQMLARYAYLYREEIQLSQLPSETLLKIQHLMAYRQRLVKSKRGRPAVALEVSAKELASYTDKHFSGPIVKDSQKHIKQLQSSITAIDNQLEQVIKQDQELHRVYKVATAGRPGSVTGIGLQTAALMLLHTHCFTCFNDWRQFACYAGTAPFEHSSGRSIRGKTPLSKVGNMKMKALLSNGASAAIQSDKEFSVYYNRKIADGKPKLVALNGVKNKMISRVFAVVQRGKPYIKDPVEYVKQAS